jgi:hypothetical protein
MRECKWGLGRCSMEYLLEELCLGRKLGNIVDEGIL